MHKKNYAAFVCPPKTKTAGALVQPYPTPPNLNRTVRQLTSQDCPKRKVRCGLGCGSEVEAQHLKHHEDEVCTQACCWEGCGSRLGPVSRRETHEQYICRHRPAECEYACGIRYSTVLSYLEVRSCAPGRSGNAQLLIVLMCYGTVIWILYLRQA